MPRQLAEIGRQVEEGSKDEPFVKCEDCVQEGAGGDVLDSIKGILISNSGSKLRI